MKPREPSETNGVVLGVVAAFLLLVCGGGGYWVFSRQLMMRHAVEMEKVRAMEARAAAEAARRAAEAARLAEMAARKAEQVRRETEARVARAQADQEQPRQPISASQNQPPLEPPLEELPPESSAPAGGSPAETADEQDE